jgi:hypothetical protein
MDDDGSALRVRAKYKSFTDLECALKKIQQDNYVQLYKRSSRKLGTGSRYKKTWKLQKVQRVFWFIRSWIIPVFMEGQISVPFPTVNAQTQGKIT